MRLSSIISDNMVIQAEKPFRIFGYGKGKISLSLCEVVYRAEFEEDEWVWELPKQKYGGPYDIMLDLDGEEKVIKNVAFGDVLLLAGQSNIEFKISDERNTSYTPCDERIRFFSSCMMAVDTADTVREWHICREGEVGAWSAIGLHTAVDYRKKKDVFVGLVGCFRGTSAIRSWLPQRTLDEKVFIPLELRHKDYLTPSGVNKDSYLYERSFLPISKFNFSCVIWYQGESDTTVEESRVYTELLRRLIVAWREDLCDENLKFIVIEICDFDPRDDDGWHMIQKCQRDIVNVISGVSVVTSKDVCEHTAIHPANKEKLAQKIAQALLSDF